MSDNSDDLEQALLLAAAAADSREYEKTENPSPEHSTNSEVHYYTKPTNTYNRCETKKNSLYQPDTIAVNSSIYDHPKPKRKRDEDDSESSKKIITGECEPTSIGIDIHKGVKRRYNEIGGSETSSSKECSHAEIVATHYNLIEEKGLDARSKSRIIYMRNFHNWIKSMLINEYLTKIKDSTKQHNPPIRVHDMCCGKGGDLSKWKKGNISHLICSDIAEVSLEHCRQRYADMKQRSQRERGRGGGSLFSLEVVHGDAGKVRYREKYADPSIKLDLVSCQFAVHYSFESLPQAECMMKNAAECLQPGGYFIGTTVDSNEIIARARKSGVDSFGNAVLQVSLEFDSASPPLFGGKYNFRLDGVVHCPEFIVHFPTFVKLANKYGLKLIRKEKFREFFDRMKHEGRQLLGNMSALERYPPSGGATLAGDASDDYVHAEEFMKKQKGDEIEIGTLSKSEWQASSLYLTFAFQKVKNTWNTDGTPHYEI